MEETVQTSTGVLPVKKWKPGTKISEPGVYDMPNEAYHSDCCIGPSISSSGLRKIRSHSPAHYWANSPLNPARNPDDDDLIASKQAVRLGRATHLLLIEPHIFKETVKTRPTTWDSWRTNAAKEWRAMQEAEGATILSGDEMQLVVGMANSLRSHPLIEDGLLAGDIERSLIWQDSKTGVWLKARPDAIPRGSNIYADLKCLRDGRQNTLERVIFDEGYDMQMALAGVGMDVLLKRHMEDFVLVVVENTRPHVTRIAPIAADDIGRARLLLRWSIDRFADCVKTGLWPGYENDDAIHVARRVYDVKRIEWEVEHGLLPTEF